MKKAFGIILVALLVAALAPAALAERYDRYEKYGTPPPPPPPRGAPVPPPTHAAYGQTYLFGHLGLFDPNSSSGGLKGYDSDWTFDIGFGSRVSPNLAVDGTFGMYFSEGGPNELWVAPLTGGFRLILPGPFIEPYVGGGVGLYFAELDEPTTGINDSDTAFGGYLSLGMDAWLNPRMALNFEGKYHWAEPEFDGWDVEVSGWTLGLGIRVSF